MYINDFLATTMHAFTPGNRPGEYNDPALLEPVYFSGPDGQDVLREAPIWSAGVRLVSREAAKRLVSEGKLSLWTGLMPEENIFSKNAPKELCCCGDRRFPQGDCHSHREGIHLGYRNIEHLPDELQFSVRAGVRGRALETTIELKSSHDGWQGGYGEGSPRSQSSSSAVEDDLPHRPDLFCTRMPLPTKNAVALKFLDNRGAWHGIEGEPTCQQDKDGNAIMLPVVEFFAHELPLGIEVRCHSGAHVFPHLPVVLCQPNELGL